MKTALAKLFGAKWLKAAIAAVVAALGFYAYSQHRRADELQQQNTDLSGDLHQAELVNDQRKALAEDQQREARIRSELPNRQAVSAKLRKDQATQQPEEQPDEQPKQTRRSSSRASSWLRDRARD